MRIERTGPVDRLTPRLKRFFVEALHGRDLDELQSAQTRKADYACLNGLLAIELKSLEEDTRERIDNLTDELRDRPDWPWFYGAVPFEAVLRNIKDPEPVRRRIDERIGRPVVNHLHKANKQLAAHEVSFPRKNLVKAVVLVNEDHEVYDPETVTYTVQRLLSRKEQDKLIYPHIDVVIYFSERHASAINGLIAFPMLCIEGPTLEGTPWKRSVTDTLLQRWGRWNGIPTFKSNAKVQTFATIEHIPDTMRRQELWELEYRRNPYMTAYTNDQVRGRFDEVICIILLHFFRDSPFKPPRDAIEWSIKTMSHLVLEMGRRAMPMTECPKDLARLGEAARRLRLPPQAVDWLQRDIGRVA